MREGAALGCGTRLGHVPGRGVADHDPSTPILGPTGTSRHGVPGSCRRSRRREPQQAVRQRRSGPRPGAFHLLDRLHHVAGHHPRLYDPTTGRFLSVNPVETGGRTRARRRRTAKPVESAWSAVPVLPPARFSRPLAEPGVPVSEYRALHSSAVGCLSGRVAASSTGLVEADPPPEGALPRRGQLRCLGLLPFRRSPLHRIELRPRHTALPRHGKAGLHLAHVPLPCLRTLACVLWQFLQESERRHLAAGRSYEFEVRSSEQIAHQHRHRGVVRVDQPGTGSLDHHHRPRAALEPHPAPHLQHCRRHADARSPGPAVTVTRSCKGSFSGADSAPVHRAWKRAGRTLMVSPRSRAASISGRGRAKARTAPSMSSVSR